MYQDITADDFISKLVNDGLEVRWDSTFTSDFILFSEFSELEGPKPIFTIPEELRMRFNLNSFAVRIMSVDCISIMQTTDLSNFNIAGDIQVVLTEVGEGAYAFVQHFVLYDILARGYVRPYCLAYVTRSYTGLMNKFKSLRHYFSLVSSLFHFGNALNFMNDLVSRCEHLFRLHNMLADKYRNICVGEKLLTESQKQSITEHNIEETFTQMKELHKIFRDYLDRDAFSEHREIFKDNYSEAVKQTFPIFCENVCVSSYEDTSGSQQRFNEFFERDEYFPDNLVTSAPSYEIPPDVIASILGKRYDKPMRHLNELCDVTFKSGVRTLKSILDNHSRDNVILSGNQFSLPFHFIEGLNDRFKAREPSDISRYGECCTENSANTNFDSLKELLKSSSPSVKKGELGLTNIAALKRTNAFDGIGNSFLTGMTITSIENPVSNAATPILSGYGSGSFLNIPTTVQTPTSSVDESNIYSSDSFKDVSATTSSDLSCQTSLSGSPAESSFDQISLSPSNRLPSPVNLLAVSMKEKLGFDYFDTFKCAQVSMLALKKKYSFLEHAVYSILIGRPLIIIAEEKNRRKVKSLVYAFANFLPRKDKCKKVIPWMSGSFTISHVCATSVVGILKNNKGKTVPNSLKPYVSILDYEDETLLAPQYVGRYLNDMFNANATFSTEVSYRRHIFQLFSEISSKVFIHFVIFYLQSGKYVFSTNYGVSMRSDVRMLQKREILGDESIILALIQNMKEEILEKFGTSFSCSSAGKEVEDVVTRKPKKTMRLNNLKSSLFTNSFIRKK